MHVGTMSRRRFTKDETELLQLVGDRVALALRIRLSDRSRVVIEAFQRTFLPEVLPFMPGLRVATRYLPATTAVGVGGDWFDTFVLPGGEIVLVIGDVAGHGLPAASLMGKMRNALRAHALMGGSPLDIVQRADEFHRYFGEGELVTLLVGVVARRCERDPVRLCRPPTTARRRPGRGRVHLRPRQRTRRSACRSRRRSSRRRWRCRRARRSSSIRTV